MKERLRDVASRFLVSAGLTRVGRRLRDHDGTLILYGHRVSDDEEAFFQGLAPNWFHEQLEYLARHYEIIPLRKLLGCMGGGNIPARDIPRIMRLYKQGALDLEKLVETRLPLDRVNEAFDALRAGETVRTVIQP